jgi:hypothetical protein
MFLNPARLSRRLCRRGLLKAAALFREDIDLKVSALVVACVAAGFLLAGCAHNEPTNKDPSVFHYLLDEPSNWKENAVDTLPPLPQPGNLLPFTVSQNTPLQFSIDSKSLSVGTDGVVRYTVVVTSPSGARNVNYEGIRCDTYEWRQYAGLNADHNGWDRTVATGWDRIANGNLNAYQASLYQDYFCANKMPVAKAPTILENIKMGRTQSMLIH